MTDLQITGEVVFYYFDFMNQRKIYDKKYNIKYTNENPQKVFYRCLHRESSTRIKENRILYIDFKMSKFEMFGETAGFDDMFMVLYYNFTTYLLQMDKPDISNDTIVKNIIIKENCIGFDYVAVKAINTIDYSEQEISIDELPSLKEYLPDLINLQKVKVIIKEDDAYIPENYVGLGRTTILSRNIIIYNDYNVNIECLIKEDSDRYEVNKVPEKIISYASQYYDEYKNYLSLISYSEDTAGAMMLYACLFATIDNSNSGYKDTLYRLFNCKGLCGNRLKFYDNKYSDVIIKDSELQYTKLVLGLLEIYEYIEV